MRPLVTTAVLHFAGTFVAALALGASDAMLAAAAVAGTFALLLWFASLHSTDSESGLPLAGATAAVGLALTGRSPASSLLPLVAAQVVGSVAAGGLVLALGRVNESATLVWDTPALTTTAVAGVLVGLIASWTVLAVDGGAPAAWWAAPTFLAGAVLNVALAAAVAPAVLIGLATAGLITWTTTLVAAGAALVGAAAGVYVVAVVTPSPE
ncbi:hypothetical protein [Aeromicrobium sp. CTD01-1L150]|uniref:hypothetical protein n=1 Tax=Aeromicrobium sp. CTD01-1L150 TaxID=3341830 RepID=UPI0035C020D3